MRPRLTMFPLFFLFCLSVSPSLLSEDGDIPASAPTHQDSIIANTINKTQLEHLVSFLGSDDPIVIQLMVDPLVHDGRFGEAFPILNSNLKGLTPYLLKLHQYCEQRLKGDKDSTDQRSTSSDPLVLADLIYRLLQNEKWEAATKLIGRLQDVLKSNPNREGEALLCLFQGMILAESGVARFFETYPLFAEANRILDEYAKDCPEIENTIAESRFRAANICGDYLVRLTRYRISNYALTIGSGDDTVFADVWFSWTLAFDMYGKSLRIAEKLLKNQEESVATARINLARLYSLRGDIVRAFKQDSYNESKAPNALADVVAIETLSLERASELANQVLSMKPHDDYLKGMAHQILASAARRHRDYIKCRNEANTARNFFVRAGKISNVVTIELLLANATIGNTEEEMKHLLIADAITDILRENIPLDEIGLNRAGYSARRSSGKERLLELFIRENRSVEALTVLEASKGRSLRDALMGFMKQNNDHLPSGPKSFKNILDGIPDNTAVLEYYIGRERCWGFLILGGQVKVFPIEIQDITDPLYGQFGEETGDFRRLPAKEFVKLVHQCLQKELSGSISPTRSPMSMAQQMKLQRDGRGFGRRWQNELLKLRTFLLPDVILDEIRMARVEAVVVIPHHILHYLPFAALVTERDEESSDRQRMPQPKFLIDESFTLFYAPSLTHWDSIRQKKSPPSNNVTAMGISAFSGADALPGVKLDMENTQSAFGVQKVATIVENDVTKKAVFDAMQKRGLLLIGTHGVNNPIYAPYSFLIVRSANGDDDALTAEEIFRSRVNSDLVVLSACYTGLAEKTPMPSDDLFGIQRALLQSGAGAVVSGMWDVYDMSGPVIVGDMMKHIAEGKPAALALTESQREFVNRERKEKDNVFTHPYFWAVYTLSGDGNIVLQ